MNWFKPKQWKKIGEVVKEAPLWRNGLYARYAVMESVRDNGDRKYKEVFMAAWYQSAEINSQIEDPLKEINEILKH